MPYERVFNNPHEVDITTPTRDFEVRNSEYDWRFQSTVIDRPDYTRVDKPNTRGKILGGGSSLNYYTWVRGSKPTSFRLEYGGESWNYENCKEYFSKVGPSFLLRAPKHNDDGEDGANGTVNVSNVP